jgi:hypothetical protein
MIVSFPDRETRQSFVAQVERERPDLLPLLRQAYSVPDIIANRLSDDQEQWVRSHLPDNGQILRDAMLAPMN